jgi:hypothetical protein
MPDSCCGNCGHSRDEHNEQGDCIHYDIGGCSCFEFVTEANATPEMRANRLFPRHWNQIYTRKAPFVAGQRCDACQSPTTSRILVNIWGTVVEYDVCEEHASYHGQMVDDFPTLLPQSHADTAQVLQDKYQLSDDHARRAAELIHRWPPIESTDARGEDPPDPQVVRHKKKC